MTASLYSTCRTALCPRRGGYLAALLAVLLFCGLQAALPPALPGGGTAPAEGGAPMKISRAAPEAPRSGGRAMTLGKESGGDRQRLLAALEESVEGYATPLQLLGTAPYYSSEAALELVLSCDKTITDAAARYGVEKAVLQAVLFQELRFLNVLDEVDLFVAATHAYLRQMEDYESLPGSERALALPPTRPVVFRLDSSTGLGQIFADTAIQAVNWQAGRQVYDPEDWHDVCAVWTRLREDDTYNIETAALVLAYKRSLLRSESGIEPSAGDIIQAYNGTGELSRRYREVVCAYCRAFRQYGAG